MPERSLKYCGMPHKDLNLSQEDIYKRDSLKDKLISLGDSWVESCPKTHMLKY